MNVCLIGVNVGVGSRLFKLYGWTITGVGVIALAGGGVAYYEVSRAHRVEIQREKDLRRRAEEQAREERELRIKYEKFLENAVGERRAAEVVLLDQNRSADGRLISRLKFLEYSAHGQAMKPRTITVEGNEVYFDALILQFSPEAVQEGKAQSLYLFRRVFTDKTRPDEGIQLFNPKAGIPDNLRSDEIPVASQLSLWREFQRCIEDPAYAETKNVRAVFGQAVYKRPRKNHLYRLHIQNNGGLIIEEKPFPAIFKNLGAEADSAENGERLGQAQ